MIPMTSFQRLLTAFQKKQPDRVPIIVRGVNPYSQFMNWRGEADSSYAPLIQRVKQDCDVEHIWSAEKGFFLNDAPLEMFTSSSLADGWKTTTTTLQTPLGPLSSIYREALDRYEHGVVKNWLTSREDVDRFLSLPFKIAQPDLTPYLQAKSELGEAGYVLPNMNDPIGFVHTLIGSENLALWSVDAPDLIQRLLEEMNMRCQLYAQALLEGGISPVLGLLGQESVVPPLMSPRQFRKMVVPYNRPLIDLAHSYGCLVSVHCHGALSAALESFLDLGVDILHPIESPPMGDITLAEAKRRVGKRICLQGNLQIGDIMLLERRQVVDMTRQAIEDAAEGGGFVLTLTATPFEKVLSQHTLDNLFAMIDTGLSYGKYS